MKLRYGEDAKRVKTLIGILQCIILFKRKTERQERKTTNELVFQYAFCFYNIVKSFSIVSLKRSIVDISRSKFGSESSNLILRFGYR